MTDHEVEQRLRTWYRDEVGFSEPAPFSLRANLTEVVDLPVAGPLGSSRRLVLIAAAVMLTVAAIGAAIAIGTGLIRLPGPGPVPARIDVISFSRADDAGGFGVYVMDADGSVPRLITTEAANGKVSWSFDGSRFAFTNSEGVHVMNADGTGQRTLVTDVGEYVGAAWSPDGVEIAFSVIDEASPAGQWDIYVMNADGSNLRQLTDGPGLDLYPAWSPDSTQIVFLREVCSESGAGRDGGSAPPCTDHLFLMDANGSGLRQLTNDPDIKSHPAWSPDGTRIAFSQRPFPPGGGLPSSYNPPWDIWVVNIDGSATLPLTSTPRRSELSPAWSPDGTRIAFSANTDGLMSIEIMDADGSNIRRLTTEGGMYFDPTWSIAIESPGE